MRAAASAQVIAELLRGNGEAALRHAQLEPSELYRRYELALAYHTLGDRAASDAALSEMIAKDSAVAAYQIAAVYAWRVRQRHAVELVVELPEEMPAQA